MRNDNAGAKCRERVDIIILWIEYNDVVVVVRASLHAVQKTGFGVMSTLKFRL